jgi:hypothetical protein
LIPEREKKPENRAKIVFLVAVRLDRIALFRSPIYISYSPFPFPFLLHFIGLVWSTIDILFLGAASRNAINQLVTTHSSLRHFFSLGVWKQRESYCLQLHGAAVSALYYQVFLHGKHANPIGQTFPLQNNLR